MIIEVTLITVVLLLSLSILWSTLRVGISPMPSSGKAYQSMLKLTEETGTGPMVDLGSGWGNVVIRLARQYPQREIIGYELSLAPWLTTCVLKTLLGLHNLRVYRQNFLDADLSNNAVIVCYLHPATMTAIQKKLAKENTNAYFLISNNFALPFHQPEQTVQLDDFYKSPVYRYRINAPQPTPEANRRSQI